MLATRVEEYPEFPLAISEAHNLGRDEVVKLLTDRLGQLDEEITEIGDLVELAKGRGVAEAYWLAADYLAGLVLFTGASLWCGLTGTIEQLIVARVFQGLGASLMTPQTMAVITRTFPATSRGRAMSLWGAVAGVAVLVGPILGGVLIDAFGWQWIFYINVPIGILDLVLVWFLVPELPTHSHKFDLVGVVLSAIGMFALVFGIQEGQSYDWGTIRGPITVWSLITAGVVVMAVFLVWQRVNRSEPLLPLGLFRDRNFSLANLAITTVGFGITAMAFPLMLYAQAVRGLSPTKAALLLVPM
ncbi:MAG TPA: MFS transporter, partial [Kribbellaceae bacterium]